MTRSAEDIEREVESTRAGLDETVEALKSKISPGQIIDELTQSLKGSGGGELFANLGSQAKENPMALALIGAGVAWLMMGKGSGSSASPVAYPTTGTVGDVATDLPEGGLVMPMSQRSEPSWAAGTEAGEGGSSLDGLKDKASDLKDRAADAAHAAAARVGDAASHARDSVMGAAGHAKHGFQSAGHTVADGAADLGHKAQRTFMNTLDREPLILGAIGLAVGAAIGAALPATRLEDRTFGQARDDLLDEAKTRAEEGLHQAQAAASAAYEGVREAAREEGLVGAEDGGSLVDKAEQVLRAGVDAAKGSLDEGRAH